MKAKVELAKLSASLAEAGGLLYVVPASTLRSCSKLSASLAEAGGLLYLVPASTLRSCSKSCFIFLTRSGL